MRLFEEYPQSQEFFSDFRGTPLEALKDDHKLSTILQEHAIRVLRVVEKVIGRIEDLEKVLYDFYLNTTPEPRYSKRARQTPFVYYIKSFTISRHSKN